METIKLWLDNPQDYLIGVHLYRLYSGNGFQTLLFAQAETAFNKKRLIEELSRIVATATAANEPKHEPLKAQNKAAKPLKPSDQDNAPAEIKEVVAERKKLYNVSRDCFAIMKKSKDKEERFQMAKLIKMNFYQINKIWAITNHFDKTGEVKKQEVYNEDLAELDHVTLNKRFESHYKYVKKNLSDDTKKDNIQTRITEMTTIKEILIKANAFLYTRYTIPTVT